MSTLSEEEGQTPFVIVHLKVEGEPIVRPLSPELAESDDVIKAVPLKSDHEPDPTDAVFPERLVVLTPHNI